MTTMEQEVRRSRFARLGSITFAATLAGLALATCGGEPGDIDPEEIEMSTLELNNAQCDHFTHKGKSKTRICHYNTRTKKFEPKDVSQSECRKHVTNTCHPKDYVAAGDPKCKGGGCIPLGAPCDSTLKCCLGSTCSGGKCVVQACTPPGGTCTLATAALCCSGVCSSGASGFACD